MSNAARALNPESPTKAAIRASMERAPLVRRLTDEQRAELAEDLEAIAAGRVDLVPREQVLEELARRGG